MASNVLRSLGWDLSTTVDSVSIDVYPLFDAFDKHSGNHIVFSFTCSVDAKKQIDRELLEELFDKAVKKVIEIKESSNPGHMPIGTFRY